RLVVRVGQPVVEQSWSARSRTLVDHRLARQGERARSAAGGAQLHTVVPAERDCHVAALGSYSTDHGERSPCCPSSPCARRPADGASTTSTRQLLRRVNYFDASTTSARQLLRYDNSLGSP